MTSREAILARIRTSLGRIPGEAPPAPPPVPLSPGRIPVSERVATFSSCFESLAGKVYVVATPAEAGECVRSIAAGRSSIASDHPFLDACGISSLPAVQSGIADPDRLRQACATCDIGVTSADYALAATGTLVMLAARSNPRLVSLLPPAHIAVFPVSCILSDLDELMLTLPDPATLSSSMVFITGPSRTADIEQMLVRGVHGPGEIHAILVSGL